MSNDDYSVPRKKTRTLKKETHQKENVELPEQEKKIESLRGTLTFRFKKTKKEHHLREVDGKMHCPICGNPVKNLNLHMSKSSNCRDMIDMEHFTTAFEAYKKKIEIMKGRETSNNNQDIKLVTLQGFQLFTSRWQWHIVCFLCRSILTVRSF